MLSREEAIALVWELFKADYEAGILKGYWPELKPIYEAGLLYFEEVLKSKGEYDA